MTFRVLGDGLPVNQVGGLEFYPKNSFVFSPADIDGLQLWLKADAGTFQDSGKTTPAVSDGDVVGAWVDQSGNGNDVIQATTVNKPLLKLNIVNSRPVIRFDGTDFLLAPYASGLNPATLTMFCVCRANAIGVFQGFISIGRKTPIDDGINISTRTPANDYASWSGVYLGGDAINTSRNLIITILYDGANKLLFNDASSFGPQTTPVTYDANNDLGIGMFYSDNLTDFLLDGDIMEVLFYNSALAIADRQSIEDYLNERYAIF